jgi:hypothetical protein
MAHLLADAELALALRPRRLLTPGRAWTMGALLAHGCPRDERPQEDSPDVSLFCDLGVVRSGRKISPTVTLGLVPRVHAMDCRDKPGNDEKGWIALGRGA